MFMYNMTETRMKFIPKKKPQKEIKMNEGYANYNVMKTL